MKSSNGADPIEFSLELHITPGAIFRSLTSQTELRRWWAPRVIMSRNIVAQIEGRDMEMRLIFEEEGRLARYSWRGNDWPSSQPSTVITFEIHDLGVSRGKTREGVRLEIIHDGWTDPEERDYQQKIWEMAIDNLKKHLLGQSFTPWWESGDHKGGFRKSNIADVEKFLERMEKEGRGKVERRAGAARLRQICRELNGPAVWYIKDNGAEVEYRMGDRMIFGMMKNGLLIIAWRDLEKILGDRLQDYAMRLSLEQDMDIHAGQSQDRLIAQDIHPDMWIQWCKEIMDLGKKKL